MSDDQDPAHRTLSSLTFERGYRLSLILDPDGTVRSVVEVEGISNLAPAVLVGHYVGAAAAGGARGAARRAAWDERIAAAHASPAPARYEDLHPDGLDGETPVVTTTVVPINAADGTLQAIFVGAHDRSDIIDAQRTVREQGELLRSALDVTQMGSFALYIREPRFESDERYREIFGYDPAPSVAADGIGALIHPLHIEDRERVGKTFMAAIRGQEGVNYHEEYRIWAPRPGGPPELRRISVLGRVEVDEQGPRRILGVVDDVTDRRRAEELRIRMQKREALGTLAGGMAHDFNNVISAILSNASVASAEVKAGADPSTSLDEITLGAKRAADLVSRMLDFSRDREPERREFSLAEIAREACRLLSPTLPAGVECRVDADDGLPALTGDPSQIHQVVMNLVTNAGQALDRDGEDGAIDLLIDQVALPRDGSAAEATLAPGAYLRLRVRDEGHGIPEEDLGRIFDPFFTTKARGEGTGLGLAAAQSIVRSHRGLIRADSIPGDGTELTVLLPLDGASPAATEPAARPPELSVEPAPGNPRVLFVDDEAALVMLAQRALPLHGLDVTAFTEPTDALAALRAEPAQFDALVTDLAMPVLTGFELIEGVRAARPDLPVVLTSGFLTAESRAEARRLGVNQVVPKPCPIDELAGAVHALTRPG